MKRVLIAVIFCFFIYSPFTLADEVRVTGSLVNVRTGPGTRYRIIKKAKRGDRFFFIKKSKGWLKVKLKNGTQGWLTAKLATIITDKKISTKTRYVKVAKENLRASPNGKKIGELFQTTKLKVLETKGKWVKVQATGWIWRNSTTSSQNQLEKYRVRHPDHGTFERFSYKNVIIKDVVGMVKIIGEITNNSGKSYEDVFFTVSVYDKKGRLLGTSDILIKDFLKDQTKSFYTYLDKVNYSSIEKWKIQFDMGF